MSVLRNSSRYLSLLLALIVCTNATSQTTQKPQEDVVRVYTELVQTDVMVFDKSGKFRTARRRQTAPDSSLRTDHSRQ
jgi:hypothetical protein